MQKHRRRWTRSVLTVIGAAAIAITIVGCASPATKARQRLAAGDTIRAVHYFEVAAQRRPHDPSLQQELTQARERAAHDLAAQVEIALAEGRDDHAVRMAQQAARYSDDFRALEQRARVRQARAFLARGEQLLADGDYARARTMAERASTAAPHLAEPTALQRKVDERNAAALAAQIDELIDVGEFARAHRLAERAIELHATSSEITALPAAIDHARHVAAFDQRAAMVALHLQRGELAAARDLVTELAGLNVRPERLAEIEATVADHQQRVDALLREARAAYVAGRYSAAGEQFDRAAGLARDVPGIANERQAAIAQHNASTWLREAQTALEAGDLDTVSRRLEQLAPIQLTGDAASQRRALRTAFHQQAVDAWMTQGNALAAVAHAEALTALHDDPALQRQGEEIRTQAIEQAMVRATSLRVDGNLQDAVNVLDDVLGTIDDATLRTARDDLAIERLVTLATRAEQRGRFSEARQYYLDALAIGGASRDRTGIAERISDVELLADMQAQIEQAQHDAAELRHVLQQREHLVADLERDLHQRERMLADLERHASQLQHAYNDLQHAHGHHAAHIHHLESDIKHLHEELNACHAEIRRLRHALNRRRRP